jgi:hypothetical protein
MSVFKLRNVSFRTEKCQLQTEKCQFRTEKCQFRTEKCQFSRYLERAAHQSSFALLRTSTVTEPVCPGLLYIWGTPAQFTPGLRCNSGVIRTTEIIMGPVCTVSPYKHSGSLYTPVLIRTTEIIMGPVCTVSPYKHSGSLYTPVLIRTTENLHLLALHSLPHECQSIKSINILNRSSQSIQSINHLID